MTPQEFKEKHGLNLEKHLYKNKIQEMIYTPTNDPKTPNLEISDGTAVRTYKLCSGCPILNYINKKFKGFESITSYAMNFYMKRCTLHDKTGFIVRCYGSRAVISELSQEPQRLRYKELQDNHHKELTIFIQDLRSCLYIHNGGHTDEHERI